MSNIKKMVDYTNDAAYVSTEQLIKTCAEEDGELMRTHRKALVIFLDNEGDDYSFHFRNAGLRLSEIVALLEVVKAAMIKELLGE